MKCSLAEELAPTGFFSDCAGLQNIAAQICECGVPTTDPFQCSLCGTGNSLPLPDRLVANKTCQAWEDAASEDFQMDCPVWQKSFGAYCGCDISADNYFDGFCQMCKDTILPRVNETVTLMSTDSDGGTFLYQEYCAWIEQDMNTKNDLNCSHFQTVYGDACQCGYEFERPTRSPTLSQPNTSNAKAVILSGFTGMGMSVVLTMMMMMR